MTDKNKGIIFIIGSATCFALMNLFIRLSGDVPTLQKCFFRNIVAFAIALVIVLKKTECLKTAKGNLRGLIFRSLCGFIGLVCNFYAVDHLNISDATILNKLAPFFAVAFSVFILAEKASRVEWLFVATAFFGALFVVKPTFSLEVIPALIGLLGGLSAGLAYTIVRKLGKNGVDGSVIVLFFSAFSSVLLLPNMIFNYKSVSVYQFLCLVMTGVCAAGGQFFVTYAYKKAPAKEISLFDYTQVVIAAVLGIIFLGQFPDLLSTIGYVIILTVAALKWRYNLKKA